MNKIIEGAANRRSVRKGSKEQEVKSTTNIAVKNLRETVTSGGKWHISLLEVVCKWALPDEVHGGREYKYLIDGEAFDWLLLAERLCEEIDELIPEDEKISLLFYGKMPQDLNTVEFRKLIGSIKYTAFLNYLYGVILEEALIATVEDEVQKERLSITLNYEEEAADEVYRRLYDSDHDSLLNQFRTEKGIRTVKSMSLSEQKEFLYWLFKLRLRLCEKARIASDIKKALSYLQQARECSRYQGYSKNHRS